MADIRRTYIYLVCAISLNALVWGSISLIRELSLRIGGAQDLALEIAVVLVSLGMFLAHWLWADRLAHQVAERQSGLRRFYLYGTLAGFFAPLLVTLNSLVASQLGLAWTDYSYPKQAATSGDRLLYDLIAIFILGLWMVYTLRVVHRDEAAFFGIDRHTGFRRLFIYAFSAWGLIALAITLTDMLAFVLNSLTGGDMKAVSLALRNAYTGLIVGLPLWFVFWVTAQRAFFHNQPGERLSVVRKLYQYGFIFAGAFMVVLNIGLILNDLLRRLLKLDSLGDWREPIPLMVVMGALWLYHAVDLRKEQSARVLTGRAGGIQRLYLYLVAGIGLLAVLAGLVGLIAVILISFEEGFTISQRTLLASTVSACLVGLPFWLLPWMSLQNVARSHPETGEGPVAALRNTLGEEGRTSMVRKAYLYLFIFLATISVLGGLTYTAYKLVGAGLGLGAPTFSELGIAVALSLIGIGVWVYHGQQLRSDGRLTSQSAALQIRQVKILALTLPGTAFSTALRTRLTQIPEAVLSVLEISQPETPETLPEGWAEQIATAGLLLLPLDAWNHAPEAVRAAVLASPARKLLAPQPLTGWAVAGLDLDDDEENYEALALALRQVAAGQDVRPRRAMNIWARTGIALLILLVGIPILIALLNLVQYLF